MGHAAWGHYICRHRTGRLFCLAHLRGRIVTAFSILAVILAALFLYCAARAPVTPDRADYEDRT